MQILTLTTDFGTSDWFVGTMKGVILGICPEVGIIDITHEIAPGDIRSAAFSLAAAEGYFPKGTIHLVVVDPGVGSDRAALAAETDSAIFIGPDNGVLSPVLESKTWKRCVRIENEKYRLPSVSRTFHGRDIFAPAAAHLGAGVDLGELGPAMERIVRLDWPAAVSEEGGWKGEVIHIDRFGNAITNIVEEPGVAASDLEVELADGSMAPVADCYSAVGKNQPVAVFGSSGRLEIALNAGNAAKAPGVQLGATVRLKKRNQ